ncbi:hypothetical protein COO60DRAFT_582027 [Scenedesmus sp. NREL 46B-D3]|nr:hypothetical protein COO60DRAFT_582027 [Scenedesmus sp. NREL 46B-D3]
MLAWGLAKLQYDPSCVVWPQLVTAAQQQLPGFKPRELSMLMWSLASLQQRQLRRWRSGVPAEAGGSKTSGSSSSSSSSSSNSNGYFSSSAGSSFAGSSNGVGSSSSSSSSSRHASGLRTVPAAGGVMRMPQNGNSRQAVNNMAHSEAPAVKAAAVAARVAAACLPCCSGLCTSSQTWRTQQQRSSRCEEKHGCAVVGVEDVW